MPVSCSSIAPANCGVFEDERWCQTLFTRAQVLSQLGGRAAAHDAAAVLEALCCAPEQDVATGACKAAVEYGAVPAIIQVRMHACMGASACMHGWMAAYHPYLCMGASSCMHVMPLVSPLNGVPGLNTHSALAGHIKH